MSDEGNDNSLTELASFLVENERNIEKAYAAEREAVEALTQAQVAYDHARERRTEMCRMRNQLIHEIEGFLMPEYEQSERKFDTAAHMQAPIRVPEATWEGRDK